MPRVSSAAVRTDTLHFLAGCRKRRFIYCLSFCWYSFMIVLFIRVSFCVLVVYIGMCSVFWLF